MDVLGSERRQHCACLSSLTEEDIEGGRGRERSWNKEGWEGSGVLIPFPSCFSKPHT